MRDIWLGAVLAATLTVVLTWPLALGAHRLGRVDSDARHGQWNIGWVSRALTTRPVAPVRREHLPSVPETLALSEGNFVGGLLAVPAWLVTGDAITAFNWTVLVAFTLAAFAMFLLVRALTASFPAAVLGAILYGFTPYMFAHLSHIQLLMTFGLPVILSCFTDSSSIPVGGGPWPSASRWPCRHSRAGTTASLAHSCSAGPLSGLDGGVIAGGGWRSAPSWRFSWPPCWWSPFTRLTPRCAGRGSGGHFQEARLFSAGWRLYLASPALLHLWLLSYLEFWREVLFPGFIAVGFAGAAILRAAWPGPTARSVVPRSTIWFYATLAALAAWAGYGPDGGFYRVLHDSRARLRVVAGAEPPWRRRDSVALGPRLDLVCRCRAAHARPTPKSRRCPGPCRRARRKRGWSAPLRRAASLGRGVPAARRASVGAGGRIPCTSSTRRIDSSTPSTWWPRPFTGSRSSTGAATTSRRRRPPTGCSWRGSRMTRRGRCSNAAERLIVLHWPWLGADRQLRVTIRNLVWRGRLLAILEAPEASLFEIVGLAGRPVMSPHASFLDRRSC